MLSVDPHPLLALARLRHVFPRRSASAPRRPGSRRCSRSTRRRPLRAATTPCARPSATSCATAASSRPAAASRRRSTSRARRRRARSARSTWPSTPATPSRCTAACRSASSTSTARAPPFRIGVAPAGASYVFNASGQDDRPRRAAVPVRRRGPVRQRGQGRPAHQDQPATRAHAVGGLGHEGPGTRLERARPGTASCSSAPARARRTRPEPGCASGCRSTSRTLRSSASGRERLLQEGDAGVEHAVVHDGVVGVAGHVEHLASPAAAARALGELAAAHLRHHHVGQQQVDAAACCRADAQRLARRSAPRARV